MTHPDKSLALRAAIGELKVLLALDDAPEARFQSWFERHPVVFDAMGFRKFVPRPRLPIDAERFLEPDFLVEDFNGVWAIFELKRHSASILKNAERRTDFRADFSEYIQQCREYAIYFADRANRETVESLYNIKIQREVPSVIVASSDTITEHSVARELLVDRGNRVELRTYSEVLRTLLRQLDWISSDTAGRPGLYLMALGLFPTGPNEQVLFDVGRNGKASRCIIGLHGSKLFVALVDADGYERRWSVERPLVIEYANASPLDLLEIEVGVSVASLYVAAHYNRRCLMQHQITATRVSSEDLAGGMAIGTDVTGNTPANFEIVECISYMRTLTLSERLQIHEHLDEVYRYYLSPLAIHSPSRLTFVGHKWMTTPGHPLSTERPKTSPDASGPWGWWSSSSVVTLNDGRAVQPDPRLGAQTVSLPGMKTSR